MPRDLRDPRDVPVALFLFNRPLMTARVFEAIREWRPRTLILVADGPRRSRPRDLFLTAEARRAVAGIDWDCTLIRHFSDVNLGCGRRMSSGIDAVFAQVDRAILLEDDCLPSSDFFLFSAEMLDRYADNPHVGMVCGTNLLEGEWAWPGPASYGFTRYTHIWGWATWRRAWRHYDFTFSGLDEAVDSGLLDRAFPEPSVARYWEAAYRSVRDGHVDTWDYQWQFANVTRGWVNVMPRSNLITNIGFGAEATHSTGHSPLGDRRTTPLAFPLAHPVMVEADAALDEATERLIYRNRP